ncbi:hypothetical protein PFW34_004227 [Escherichia coli]|uniref:phage tailspike protein n=1 Tax=Escherichia coli TaxID=562 RepID=UPI0003912815|nr:phage tailspike protein [Escherichia coli]EKI8356143.1 hypothetical protein [Escherichia coli]EQY98879.1 bifunctional tail protein [Escherichia coli UMEA 3329-1]HAX7410204.1 hypothetical protein [Escherichia coli]HAX7478301.1 hypothetical protein [Escherichia coli]
MADIVPNVVVTNPRPIFTDSRTFKALPNGRIYIGQIDTDPVNPANQIPVYIENEDGSHVQTSQPLVINAAGKIVYNGQLVKIVTVEGHSMAIYDAYGTQVDYIGNVLKYDPDQLRSELGQDYGPTIVNDAKIAVQQPYSGSVNRTQHQKNSETISVLDFKLDSDPDWTLAFNRASLVSAQQGKVVYVPAGEYTITDSILLYDAEDIYGDKYYMPDGSKFKGEGSYTIIKKEAVSSQDVNAVFYAKGKRNIHLKGITIIDETAESYGYYTPNTATRQQLDDVFITATKWGVYFGGNAFVGVMLSNLVIQGLHSVGIYGGVHVNGGTSYCIKNCSVFYSNYCSFELSGSYVELGPLASDDCSGTPYIFNAGSYSASSLGCEQPDRANNGTLIKGVGANLSIGVVHIYTQTQVAGSYFFDLTGYAKITINEFVGSSDVVFNGARSKTLTGAKLDIIYSNKSENAWPQKNIYDTVTSTFSNIGYDGGTATIPNFGTTVIRDLSLPNPDQSAGPYYRIMGGYYGSRGCIGTVYTLRSGTGMNSIAGAYDFNVVGSDITPRAKLVKAAHCSSQALTDYDGWFTGTYNGTNYILCRMPVAGGYRNLGTFFSGVVFGQDSNMFKALLSSEITGLTAFSGGEILIASATPST